MDVSLTDLLTCPRCGPTYGLVLLPNEVRDRRVESGVLGCANCRERYPVVGGVVELRSGDAGGVGERGDPGAAQVEEAVWPGRADREAAVRLAALLGLSDAGGTVVLGGPAAAQAGLLAGLVSDLTVVVLSAADAGPPVDGGVDRGGDGGAVTHLHVGAVLPLRGRSMRGVALTGVWSVLLEEGARLLAPAGRLLVAPAPGDAAGRLEPAGLRMMLEEAGTVVAARVR